MSRLATGALGPPAVPPPSLDDLLNVDWFRYSILKPENARAIGLATQHLLWPPEETNDLDGGANCAGNCVLSEEKSESSKEQKKQDKRDAEQLGYPKEVKPDRAPMNTHGKPAYEGKRGYISRDRDQHKGGYWKKFDRKGQRSGTWNRDLSEKIGD